LKCDSQSQCDKYRVSAYDPVNKMIYFQAHNLPGDDDYGVGMYALILVHNNVTGKPYWVINQKISTMNYYGFGQSGYQFVSYPASAKK
jgi:hypothetical protein